MEKRQGEQAEGRTEKISQVLGVDRVSVERQHPKGPSGAFLSLRLHVKGGSEETGTSPGLRSLASRSRSTYRRALR